MGFSAGAMTNMSVGMSAASALSGAVGSYFSARSAKLNAGYQAHIAETNARLAELSAQSELFRGQRKEQSVRLRTAHIKSAQRTNLAANGIDLGSQTAVETLTTTDMMGEIDANTANADAIAAAWGYRTQSTNFSNEALMKRTAGDAITPALSGATSLLSGASNVANNWFTMKYIAGKG